MAKQAAAVAAIRTTSTRRIQREKRRKSLRFIQDHVQQKVERIVALIRLGGRDVVGADVIFLSSGVF